jgi:hypothetical protein
MNGECGARIAGEDNRSVVALPIATSASDGVDHPGPKRRICFTFVAVRAKPRLA